MKVAGLDPGRNTAVVVVKEMGVIQHLEESPSPMRCPSCSHNWSVSPTTTGRGATSKSVR